MSPTLSAFVDELALIKLAQTKSDSKFKPEAGTLLKSRLLKSAPKYALGAGLGMGAGWLLGEKTRPWMLKNMTPAGRTATLAAATGLGALAALGTWEALRTAHKEEQKDLAKKNG